MSFDVVNQLWQKNGWGGDRTRSGSLAKVLSNSGELRQAIKVIENLEKHLETASSL